MNFFKIDSKTHLVFEKGRFILDGFQKKVFLLIFDSIDLSNSRGKIETARNIASLLREAEGGFRPRIYVKYVL